MKRAILTCMIATFLGCAQPGRWQHPTATSDQLKRDQLECEYDASKATANIRSGIEAGYQQAELRRMCLQARGYEWIRQ
ncbi:MAG: hypothetical protein EPO27_10485 [Betaproteobacteria bacterium]|nr:MAG: hypothetical protein EPO27_10485 [Betaproteobacteria bacterium]